MSTVALGVLASGPAADAVTRHVPQLVAEGFASRLFAKDPTLWGPEAVSESSVRLSWVGLGRTSRPLIGEVSALRDLLAEQGVDHVVLCGMGGSSLAPEVICASAGVDLTVLDSSQPDSVRAALADRLDRHRMLSIAYGFSLLQSLLLAAASMAGVLGIGMLGVLAFAHGTIHAFSVPAAFGLLPRAVAREQLPAAIAFSSSYRTLAMFAGPALAGVLLAESEYRHELESQIRPFEGLLLGR